MHAAFIGFRKRDLSPTLIKMCSCMLFLLFKKDMEERTSLFIVNKIGLDTRANLNSAFSLTLGYAKVGP